MDGRTDAHTHGRTDVRKHGAILYNFQKYNMFSPGSSTRMNPVACRLLSSKYYLVYNSVRRKYEDKTKGFNFSSNILENSCSKEETPQVPTQGQRSNQLNTGFRAAGHPLERTR